MMAMITPVLSLPAVQWIRAPVGEGEERCFRMVL